MAIAPAPRSCHRGWKWCGRRARAPKTSEIIGYRFAVTGPAAGYVQRPRRCKQGGTTRRRPTHVGSGCGMLDRVQGDERRCATLAGPARLSLASRCRRQLPRDLAARLMLQEGALEQIPVGATQEQVLIVLGTPSTVATVSGEAFYYISQRSERRSRSCRRGDRPARGRGLFRQGPPGRAAGQLRPQGRQGFRLPDARPRRPAATSSTYVGEHAQGVQLQCRRCGLAGAETEKGPARCGPFVFCSPPFQCASTASSSSATMLVILIIGLTAGPAVSL